MKLVVIKRNLAQEPFIKGRIALAVFKACSANDKNMSSTLARQLGSQVAQKVEEYALGSVEPSLKNRDVIELDIEWIQDEVIRHLEMLGFNAISKGYAKYRLDRQQLREEKQKVRLNQMVIESKVYDRDYLVQKIVGISQQSGITLSSIQLEQMLFARSKYETRQLFSQALLEVLFDVQQGTENWDVLLGRWYFYVNVERFCNIAWLDCPWEQLAGRIAQNIKQKLITIGYDASYVDHVFTYLQEEWFVLEGQLGFSGQQLMTQKLGQLCSVSFLQVAMRLLEDPKDVAQLFEKMIQGQIVFPLLSQRALIKNQQEVGFERALRFEDETEAIFAGLLKVASLVKKGCSVSLDISALRGKGVAVGKDGNVSAGLSPVMNMVGQTCSMLSGVSGEQQKARIFLEVWHWDLEEFLAFGRSEQKVVRTGLLISDLFMRHVMENKMWVLCTPENINGFFTAKNIKERERILIEKIEALSQQEEPFSRLVPARNVFDWICSACTQGEGCSIVFRDLMRTYDGHLKNMLPSARLGALVRCDGDDHIMECALVLGEDVDKNVQLLHLMDRVQQRWAQTRTDATSGVGVCLLGCQDSIVVTRSLSVFFEKYGRVWDMHSFWGLSNPWESFKKGLYQARSGYLETIGNTVSWKGGKGPSFGRFLLQTPREEYLWLTRQPPIWVPRSTYQYQYRWNGKKALFGVKKPENVSIQEQAHRASEWQTLTDQILTWDVFLNELEPRTVAESIKSAWIYGLRVVRRFVKNN